jgi:hypothetical protein
VMETLNPASWYIHDYHRTTILRNSPTTVDIINS